MLAYDATTGGPLAGTGLGDWLTTAGRGDHGGGHRPQRGLRLGYVRAALPLLLGRTSRATPT